LAASAGRTQKSQVVLQAGKPGYSRQLYVLQYEAMFHATMLNSAVIMVCYLLQQHLHRLMQNS